ncbi:helix-turn-helix domain-containing protein [Bacillus sp. CGMCC 1.16607]|uniref:helix-turn-helix domain-containing protein n=1 Tax=Bacillus sp. CGMCC 1.16607 TaxID=3351842 RepID=UPI003638EF87
MIHILIANRERYETNGMEWLLKSNDASLNIGQANNLSELIHKMESFPVDILILEIEILAQSDQEKILKWIKVLRPRVIGITLESTFETAMKAIDIGVDQLLLKPVSPEQLQRSVQTIVREIKSNQLFSPVMKKQKSKIELTQLFNDDETTAKEFVFLGFKVEIPSEINKLFSFLKDYSFQKEIEFFSLSDCIIGIAMEEKLPWYEECQRLLRDWQLYESQPLSIVISLPTDRNITIHGRYLEINKLLDATFFTGFNRVIQYEEEIKWKVIDPFLTPSDQKLWIDFLNQSNLSGIKEWLYMEFLHLGVPYPDPGLIRIRLTSILAQIRRYMKEKTVFLELEEDYLNLFNQVLYSTIIYRNVQELILFTSKIFNLKEIVSDQKKDLIENCLDYVYTHFWNSQLTLEGIAEIFNRNPAYLSSLFVQKQGKSFREILNDARINNARKLLSETDLSIKEISNLCGFSNQQYFTRVFKQKNNQTPNQYRGQNT